MPQHIRATTTPNTVSSVLLALRRMYTPSPWHVLPHLRDPKPPHDYHFLDAFATLCSFLPQCESASTAIQQGPAFNYLYLATSPSAPQTLRTLINALVRALPGAAAAGPGPSSSPGLPASSIDHPDPSHPFIVQVYRSCHRKLLDAVNRDDTCAWLLEDLSSMSAAERRSLKITEEEYTALLDGVTAILDDERQDVSAFSDTEVLDLHRVAQNIGEFKDQFSAHPFIIDAHRISRAVNAILTWAMPRGSEKHPIGMPLEIVFVDPPSTPDFLATTNMDEVATGVGKALYDGVSRNWDRFEPPEGVSEVDGSPGHFTGHGVVHCESALLHHVLDERISVHPYIGCSHPTCYACLMLLRACRWATGEPFSVGRRSADLEELDVAWSCPPMGAGIYQKLERDVLADFGRLCLQPNSSHYPVSIVSDSSDLPTLSRYLDSFEDSGV